MQDQSRKHFERRRERCAEDQDPGRDSIERRTGDQESPPAPAVHAIGRRSDADHPRRGAYRAFGAPPANRRRDGAHHRC